MNTDRFQTGSEKMLLRNWLKLCEPDKQYSYNEIEEATSVIMDKKGKALLRAAAKQESIEYESIRGVGISIGGPLTGVGLMRGRFQAVTSKINIAERSYRNIAQRHLADMQPEEQKKITFIGATFAAMRSASLMLSAPQHNHNLNDFIPKLP